MYVASTISSVKVHSVHMYILRISVSDTLSSADTFILLGRANVASDYTLHLSERFKLTARLCWLFLFAKSHDIPISSFVCIAGKNDWDWSVMRTVTRELDRIEPRLAIDFDVIM